MRKSGQHASGRIAHIQAVLLVILFRFKQEGPVRRGNLFLKERGGGRGIAAVVVFQANPEIAWCGAFREVDFALEDQGVGGGGQGASGGQDSEGDGQVFHGTP